LASNCSAKNFFSSIGHIPMSRSVMPMTNERAPI
jgi:hypothetical protein